MSIGEDLRQPMIGAVTLLNAVQAEFRFKLIPADREIEGLAFERNSYLTHELWSFMEAYRTRAGGQHPYIIGFLNRPLSSNSLANLFGSHDAQRGLVNVGSRFSCEIEARYIVIGKIKRYDRMTVAE